MTNLIIPTIRANGSQAFKYKMASFWPEPGIVELLLIDYNGQESRKRMTVKDAININAESISPMQYYSMVQS